MTTPSPYLDGDAVLLDPAVHDIPVEIREERVDVRGAIGLVVEEIRMLVDIERDERRRVPDRERVLRVADVVEQPPFVPVVRCPRPAAAGHTRCLQVRAPVLVRAEVTLDQVADEAVRVPAAAAEVLEVDLVVLDPADGEREVDLERADVGIDLVRAGRVDARELLEDLVPLVDVTLVELVVRVDRGTGDAVQLVELGLELPRGYLLERERQRCHGRGAYPRDATEKGATDGPRASTTSLRLRRPGAAHR